MATQRTIISKSLFLTALLMFSLFPQVYASHSISLDVDKPDGGYVGGKDKVTFTIKNTGNDLAYVDCGGVKVYADPQGGPQQQLASETNLCYAVNWGTLTYSYVINAGNTHTWQWNQKDFNGNQVADGKYLGKIVTDENTNNEKPWQTHGFWIDTDTDGMV